MADCEELVDNEELKYYYNVKKSSIHGKGLFAAVKIKRGEYMGSYDGPRVKDNGMHVLWVEENEGKWVGYDGQNMLRYLNHCNEPNAEFDGRDLYALRTIKKGEEITFDYGEEP